MHCHDVEKSNAVGNVNTAVTVDVGSRIGFSTCHVSENCHYIGNVNEAVTVYITQDAKSAQSSVIATLYLPLEQRPTQTDGTILVPSFPLAHVVTNRLLVLCGSRLAMDGTPAEVFARAEELVEMGLNIPQVTRVFLELRKMGLNVELVYTLQQAVDALTALRGGNA